MGYGAMLFATALTDATIVDVLGSRAARPVLAALAREVMAVAATEAVAVMGFNGYDPAAFGSSGDAGAIDRSFDAMVEFNRRSAKARTGVWRDIAVHHRKTECDAQFGPIIALARRRGVAVAHIERLVTIMREVESGVRAQSWDNLTELAGAGPEARIDAHPV
jgi:2-dehydropantoate 2-reductase